MTAAAFVEAKTNRKNSTSGKISSTLLRKVNYVKTSLFLATALSMATALSVEAASVTIDDFLTLQQVQTPDSGLNPTASTVAAAEAIGGVRTIYAERTSPAGSDEFPSQYVEAGVFSGLASVATGVNTEGYVEFTWDAGAAYDLVDTTNDQIVIMIDTVDLPGTTYTLELDGISVTKAVSAGELTFGFAEFAGEDGTSVDSIKLTITGPASFDTSFSFIGANSSQPETPAVPLPASGLLLIAGSGALMALRRRKS